MSTRITKDGRTIRTGKDYTEFRRDLRALTNGRCSECGRETYLEVELESDWSFHTDHTNGRAAGKRDDTFLACKGKCGRCHRIKHNQQSAVQSEPQWSRA